MRFDFTPGQKFNVDLSSIQFEKEKHQHYIDMGDSNIEVVKKIGKKVEIAVEKAFNDWANSIGAAGLKLVRHPNEKHVFDYYLTFNDKIVTDVDAEVKLKTGGSYTVGKTEYPEYTGFFPKRIKKCKFFLCFTWMNPGCEEGNEIITFDGCFRLYDIIKKRRLDESKQAGMEGTYYFFLHEEHKPELKNVLFPRKMIKYSRLLN